MTGLIVVAVLFAAALGFGGIQTWNLLACQRQYAQAVAEYTRAIEVQNTKVSEWEGKAKSAQAKSAGALKQKVEETKRAKERAAVILSQPRPSAEANCEAREAATLGLLRRARTP